MVVVWRGGVRVEVIDMKLVRRFLRSLGRDGGGLDLDDGS